MIQFFRSFIFEIPEGASSTACFFLGFFAALRLAITFVGACTTIHFLVTH